MRAPGPRSNEPASTTRRDDPVSSFSRGMRQRVALERALIHDPRLALLDEPFTGLDDASSEALLARLRALRDSGAIVILATHDLDLAEGLLDHALFLRDGRIVEAMATPGALAGHVPAASSGDERPDEMMLRAIWLIVRKDLTVEVRSRELAYTTLFFAVSCVLVFAFSLVQEGRAAGRRGAAGRALDGDHVCRKPGARDGRSSASASPRRCAR